MSNLTTILEDEAGLQYQGVKDASSQTGTYPVVGLIIGTFKRGRYDKPMTITRENIRGQLGYEPENPNYVAVQDVLDAGVPSVQVVRISGSQLMCVRANYSGYIQPIDSTGEPIVGDKAVNLFSLLLSSLTIEINDNGEKIPYSKYNAIEWDESRIRFNIGNEDMKFYLPGGITSVVFCSSIPLGYFEFTN